MRAPAGVDAQQQTLGVYVVCKTCHAVRKLCGVWDESMCAWVALHTLPAVVDVDCGAACSDERGVSTRGLLELQVPIGLSRER